MSKVRHTMRTGAGASVAMDAVDVSELEECFAAAFEHAPIGMVLVGLDGKPLRVNRALADMLGYTPNELLEKSVAAVTHPEDLPDAHAHLQRLLSGELLTYQLEKRYLHRDGHLVRALLNVSLVRNGCGAPKYVICQVQDLSARLRTEERLRESEQRYRLLAEYSTDVITRYAPDGTIVDTSPACRRVLGFEPEELVGRRFIDFVHPDDVTATSERYGALLRGDGMQTMACRVRRKDGDYVWLEATPSVVPDPQTGAVREVIAVSRDVTARKRVEEELRRSEERLALALAGTNDGLSDWDFKTGEVYYSPRFVEILGLADGGLRPDINAWEALIHPDDRERVKADLRQFIASNLPQYQNEHRLLHADGTYRWVLSRGVVVRSARGTAYRMVGSLTDIDDRKRTEETLRIAGERVALAMAGANDGLWDWNVKTGAVYFSRRWKQILGYGPREMRAHIDEWLLRLHPDEYDRVGADLQAHLEARTPHYESEYRLRHRDGTYRIVHARGLCLRDASGEAYRMAGSLTDVTERRQLEARARRHEAELARVLRLSAMGEMAAAFAHEVSQPLTAIVSFANGGQRRVRAGAAGIELLGALEQIAQQALRAGAIISRFRGFRRKTGGRLDVVHMNDLVRNVAALAEAEAREHGATVRVELAARLPLVEVDSLRVEQVLLNLIRNGIEAMEAVPPEQRELVIRTAHAAADGEVEVVVTDTGEGVPAAIAERVFEPFFTTKKTGLGIGLSVSRSVVESYGGRVWMAAGAGGGARFHFTLPRVERGDANDR